MEPDRLTARQIEAARRAITRHMKRAGRVWIRVFPDVPVSKKPAEVRMGSGKGAPEFWAARVKPGRILFELDGVSVQVAKEALALGRRQAADQDALRRPRRRRGLREKAMKATDLRPKTKDQLKDELGNLRKEAFNLRFQKAGGQLRQDRPRAPGAPRHRPHQDGAGREGRGLRSKKCRSEFSKASSSATRWTRPSS